MRRIRILIADDHVLVADALKSLLERDYDVVGVVADGRMLLDAAKKLRPDLIVVDVGMPQLNGLDATRQVKRLFPTVKVLVVTMNEDTGLAVEAFRAGASGYILKHSASKELLQAIHEVMVKESSYLSPRITGGILSALLRGDNAESEKAREITPRQREVIQLLAEGRSMKEISDILSISLRTVAAHKYRVMEMLEIKTNADLYRYAIKHQIVAM